MTHDYKSALDAIPPEFDTPNDGYRGSIDYIEQMAYWAETYRDTIRHALTAQPQQPIDDVKGVEGAVGYLQNTLNEYDGCELNMYNYDHDDVCAINDSYVGLFQSIEEAIKQLSAHYNITKKGSENGNKTA